MVPGWFWQAQSAGHSSPAPALLPPLSLTWGGGVRHLYPAPFLGPGALLVWIADFLPSFLPMPLGLRPLPLSPEDCVENGPLGLLRTLTICTLQVDLIYLFCDKEEMEKYFIICRDSKLYPNQERQQ